MISHLEKAFEGFEFKAKQEGIAEGRAEGRAEVAKRMLDLGMDIQTIAKATGLTLEEIGS
jgi:predicted transposase/invertase (TIGR01784 family)